MADDERLTKAERRERRRQERIEEEAQQAAAASKAKVRNAGIGVVSIAAIGGLVALALGNGTADLTNAVTLSVQEGLDAQDAAGCIVVDDEPLPDRTHFEPSDIPPADQLYTDGRPTNSGSHYTNPQGVVTGASNRQLDEFATTHNLEHGSIIVWYDPAQVDGGTVDDIDDWVSTFNAAGFANEFSGAGLFASPYEDPGITSGKALALRAWGFSMDCDEWDETAVNAFTIDHYGTNGISPESTLGPYPAEVLAYADVEQEEVDELDPDDVGDMAPEDETETETEDTE